MHTFFITGVAGFIGSNIAEKLIKSGYKVIGLDDFSSGKIENVKFLESLLKENGASFEFINNSVLNFDIVNAIATKCDYIIHLAAQVSNPRSIEIPIITHKINTEGTLNIFQSGINNKNVKRIIYASSAAVYGTDAGKEPINEEYVGKVLTPYAATKKANEVYAQAYYNSYKLDTVGLRFFNVFGPRQDPSSSYSGVLSIFMNNLLSGKTPIIQGDGKQTRDFIYIKDLVDIIIGLCFSENKIEGEIFNIGTGKAKSISEILEILKYSLNKDIDSIYQKERVGDIKYSCSNISKLIKMTGLSPKYTFEEGIKDYINYMNNS